MTEKFFIYIEQYSILFVIFAIIFVLKDPVIILGKYLIDTKFSEIATLKEIQKLLNSNNDLNNVVLIKKIQTIIKEHEDTQLPHSIN